MNKVIIAKNRVKFDVYCADKGMILVDPGKSCGCDYCKDVYGLNLLGWFKRIFRRIR